MARNPPKYFPISTVTVLENIVTNVYSTKARWTEPGSEMQKCIIGIHHIFPSFLWYLVVVLQNYIQKVPTASLISSIAQELTAFQL